MQTIC